MKVLVLEGGGAFGAIIAYFLAEAYKATNKWLDDVDCLSGCSIGGILALGYSDGKRPEDIYELFKSRMKDCFEKRTCAYINPLANPTYTNAGIDKVLEEVFATDTISDIKKQYPKLSIFIPALNITDNSYKVFDNIEGQDDGALLKDVAGYTSCAPSYYYGRDYRGKCIVDGGLIEVAPLITTITGLKGKLGIPFEEMDVLMLGCGERTDTESFTVDEYNSTGLLGLAKKLIVPYTTQSNNMSTLYWGANIGLRSFVYFNPVPVKGGMDDVDAMNDALKLCPVWKDSFIQVWKDFINIPSTPVACSGQCVNNTRVAYYGHNKLKK